MKTQEAIEVLKANYPDACYGQLREAVDMAIEALSEPSRQGQRDGLISLQALTDAIDKTTWYHQNRNKDMVSGANSNEHQAWYKVEDVYKALESVPSAQTEQRKGEWKIYVISMFDGEGCKCSECGFEGAPYWDYCPNCGADMRGEEHVRKSD